MFVYIIAWSILLLIVFVQHFANAVLFKLFWAWFVVPIFPETAYISEKNLILFVGISLFLTYFFKSSNKMDSSDKEAYAQEFAKEYAKDLVVKMLVLVCGFILQSFL